MKEFDEESLSVSHGHLFCSTCREEISLKRSIVKNHILSQKHHKGKEQAKSKRRETLPKEQQMYRVKVVAAFLRAGVPLNKIESFREILEENAHRLTDRRHMYDYVPFVLKQEEDSIRTELSGKDVSVIFDGTSRLGEALAIILRFVDDEWIVQQRLVRLQMLSKSLTGEETARELINVLSVTYHIRSGNLLATMRDRAASNGVAIRTIKVVYPGIVDVGCFSHTLDHP